jgi:hypothetical protein
LRTIEGTASGNRKLKLFSVSILEEDANLSFEVFLTSCERNIPRNIILNICIANHMITVVESANQETSRFLLPYMPKVEKAETIIYWTISSVKVDMKNCLQTADSKKEPKKQL